MEFVLGDLIWIYPHDELSWNPGEIVQVNEDSYIVASYKVKDDNLYSVEKANALPVHPSCLNKVPDLLALGEFNEGALLHTIRERYFDNKIYTSVGTPILISVNPYCKLPIYSGKISDAYRKGKDENPHLFLMAEKAYSALRDGNQSIIISGESGAGKTEAAKIILSYLAGSASDTKNNLAKQVLDTNPILEAFGNAKTLRNDNSSRFGKFIEIHFDNITLKLLSARIQNYLLEKSRIVNQQLNERNYHFFYQLCAGASLEEREKYSINEANYFNYLNQSECWEIEGVDDGLNYKETRECMKVLGFTDVEQGSILSIVMGILHLGNVKFEGSDQAEILRDGSLEIACGLLGVSVESLEKVLVSRVIVDPSNGKEIIMSQTPSQAVYSRDATSKAIYSKLFSWLVERINKTIFIQQKKPTKIIGLLDIYGFEVFDNNSFEQFCINYANEKLQQHFNHHMFKSEQAEYSKEKIKWDHIKYDDNQECIDLIEKSPIGIISLLDEQCKLQKGTDRQFLVSLGQKLVGNSKLCNSAQFANEFFGIGHYAGNVFYAVNGFLEKNKDSLNPLLAQAMEKSSLGLVKDLFTTPKQGKQSTPGSLSALTLAAQFKSQLQDLIKALSGSTPTYIRCIKPNSDKQPKEFDSKDVQRQLRCAGMLECIRIRKAGYSVRRSIKEFIDKYSLIIPSFKKTDQAWTLLGKTLLDSLSKVKSLKSIMKPEKKLIQIGISMVFMKDELRQALDIEYSKKAAAFAIMIQKWVKKWIQRKKYKKFLYSIKKIQKVCKDWLWYKKLEKLEKNIKKSISSLICRSKLQSKKKSLTILKSFLQISASKLYLSYFRPISKPSQKRKNSLKASKISHSKPDDTPDSTDSKKSSAYSKELTQGQSSVIGTVQREVNSLNYLLQREKEKTKSIQEESDYYKELYLSTLSKLEKLELEKSLTVESKSTSDNSKSKQEILNMKNELKSKTNELSMMTLKLDSLKSTISELEENNKDLKAKQSVWEQKLYAEMRKNALDSQELKQKLAHGDSEKLRSEKTALDKEIRGLKVTLRQYEAENSSLKSDLQEAYIKIEDFQETEQRLKDQIKSLQQHISQSNKEESNITISKKIQELHKAQELLQQENEDLIDEKENLQVELNKLTLSETHFKEEFLKAQKMNKEKTMKIRELENEIENLHHEKLELTRAKIELKNIKKNSGGGEENSELRAQVKELNQEIEDLIRELEAAKQIHGTLLTLVKIKNNELEVLKQAGSRELMEDLEREEKGLLEA